MISASVWSSAVEMWSIGRIAVSPQRIAASFSELPQGWKVCRTAGCLPTNSANSLNSAVVPRSLTPKKRFGLGGTRVIAAAGAAPAAASAQRCNADDADFSLVCVAPS